MIAFGEEERKNTSGKIVLRVRKVLQEQKNDITPPVVEKKIVKKFWKLKKKFASKFFDGVDHLRWNEMILLLKLMLA